MEESVRRVWAALGRESTRLSGVSIADLFGDAHRTERFTFVAADLRVDLSRQRIDEQAMRVLLELVRAGELDDRRSEMFSGGKLNATEQRPVLHVALRAPSNDVIIVDGLNVVPLVHDTIGRMARLVDELVKSGVETVVNIGIGGSDLGPAMAARALAPFATTGISSRFVSNVDPADLADCLADLDPTTTAFVVASKTFTTQETMANASSAVGWLSAGLGLDRESVVASRVFAVSSNVAAAGTFGVPADHVLPMWDWVGGRFSIGSAIGFSLMCSIGEANFRAMLAGMRTIDEHFVDAPFESNVPVLMALVEVLNRNGFGYASRAVIPYLQQLSRFPAYLQQLEMESNGKRASVDGAPVELATSPIVWGEPGTNGQHAFFQLLHQGTDIVPVDFIGARRSTASGIAASDIESQHDKLMANLFAQASALAFGAPAAADNPNALGEHRAFPGNRPSTTILFDALTPSILGQLIALYEHKTFVEGVIWNINSFDQWGVELGKVLAGDVLRHMAEPHAPTNLDPATRAAVDWYNS
ncbi:MAG: glucosephosphate isomerase [Actinomycetota bacterium]